MSLNLQLVIVLFILTTPFSIYTQEVISCDNANETNGLPKDIIDNIFLQYYIGPSANDYIRIPYNEALTMQDNENFDKNWETVFYFPGWTEQPSQNEFSVITLAEAFLSRNSTNFVVFDYGPLVRGEYVLQYFDAVANVSKIGCAIGTFLKHYIPDVQKNEYIHLVSHSMGSQIMSQTAQVYGQGKLNWLTALDPAGPLFNLPFIKHLSKNDALFVDVIHTDAGVYGDSREIGHADFFPNRGTRIQPYCVTHLQADFCSHEMSWMYYAMSIRNETLFVAQKCQRSILCVFSMTFCCAKNSSLAYMGYGINKKIRGTFFLKTTDSMPFGFGKDGLYV